METYDPTIEDSYRKQVVLDDDPATLEVLDTAGQEEYTALRDQWIREGEGFILVYSITSRSSFTRIRTFFNQIQRVKEDSDPYAVVIVGNKSDRSDEREVSTQEGEVLAKELGDVPFFESSAKNNINIEEAFMTCARVCKYLREGTKHGPASAAAMAVATGAPPPQQQKQPQLTLEQQQQQQQQQLIQQQLQEQQQFLIQDPNSIVNNNSTQQHVPSTRRSSRNYIPNSTGGSGSTMGNVPLAATAAAGGTQISATSRSSKKQNKKDKKCIVM